MTVDRNQLAWLAHGSYNVLASVQVGSRSHLAETRQIRIRQGGGGVAGWKGQLPSLQWGEKDCPLG